jgi:cysteine desulfurase
MGPLYLDHNATTPLLPEAWDAMRPVVEQAFGNPSSAHQTGRKARRALEDAREQIAALLGASPDEVTFTSGATEANNLAVFGLANRTPDLAPRHVLASPLEHPCVIGPLKELEARGFTVEWLPVSARGVVPANAVASFVRPETAFVSVMLANHETGAIQPVREIAATLPPGVPLHTDAAQAAGKIPINFRALGATALTASAHKFRGPKGIGVLLVKRGTTLRPLMFGGHQQQGRRPGTEPVALAVGMAVALEHAVRNLEAHRSHLEAIRARLEARLRDLVSPIVVNGPGPGSADALPTTLNVSFPGCRADLLLMALDLAGVACSTGSACSSGSLLPSPVLRAIGVPDDILRSALRFSFGPTLSFADIDDAAGRIGIAVKRLREGEPSWTRATPE